MTIGAGMTMSATRPKTRRAVRVVFGRKPKQHIPPLNPEDVHSKPGKSTTESILFIAVTLHAFATISPHDKASPPISRSTTRPNSCHCGWCRHRLRVLVRALAAARRAFAAARAKRARRRVVGAPDVVAQHARHERRPETGRDAALEPRDRQEPLSRPVGGLTDSAIAPARGTARRSPLHAGAPTTTPLERAHRRPSRTRVESGAAPPESFGGQQR